MISLENFAAHIEALPISEEDKNDLLTLVYPCFDFRKYLQEKHNLNPEQVENLIQLQIAGKKDELYKSSDNLDTADYTHLIIGRMVKIMEDFATAEGYSNVEAFSIALKKLLYLGVQENQRIRQALN